MNKLVARKSNWARLSTEWERSGLSQKAFCEKHGVSYTNFCYHRSALRKRERVAARRSVRAEGAGQFIPVTVEVEESSPQPSLSTDKASAAPAPSAEVEVALPFGVVLRFRGVAAQ